MSANEDGYLYRRAQLDEAGLRALLATVFEQERVWAFGANTVTLQEIQHHDRVSEVALAHTEDGIYDFGHVFADQAEIRWKRDEQGTYDALVLTEQPVAALEGEELLLDERPQVRRPKEDAWLLLTTPDEDKEKKRQWRLGYVEYIADNQAVLFVRFTVLDPTRRMTQ
jgi:hypothetical protein